MTMLLPKRADDKPIGKFRRKLKELDDNDAFTLYVVVINDTEILKVTTSERKAKQTYRQAMQYGLPELWKKTVSLCNEGPPRYQVVNGQGKVLRDYPSWMEGASYLMGMKGKAALQRVTKVAHRSK